MYITIYIHCMFLYDWFYIPQQLPNSHNYTSCAQVSLIPLLSVSDYEIIHIEILNPHLFNSIFSYFLYHFHNFCKHDKGSPSFIEE